MTAVCSQIKNSRRYLEEWIKHYLDIVGVDHIFLFEDYGSESHADICNKYDKVTLSTLEEFGIPNYKDTRNQYELFSKFFNKLKEEHKFDWVMFIDDDEFLDFEKGYNLQRLEIEYQTIPALLLPWKCFGANGHIKRPEGGLKENYTKEGVVMESNMHWAKKSLINIDLCSGLQDIHIAKGAVDIEYNDIESAPLIYKKAWFNHYFTKSWEDYCERFFERGALSSDYRTLDQFFICNPDMEHLDQELIQNVRYRYAISCTWLSRKYKLISGGNLNNK